MATPQHPADADSDESPAAQPAPVPDEDGPHDVPDDKVIEKTLPTGPLSNSGGAGSSASRDKPQE